MSGNRLKSSLTYLIGSIDNCPTDGIKWRQAITPKLQHMGISVLDPTSKPLHCSDELDAGEVGEEKASLSKLKEEGKWDELHEQMKYICHVDLRLVQMSSFVIANIEPDIHMCGSYFEISAACANKIPVLILCEQGLDKIPHWLHGILPHEDFFTSQQDLIDRLQAINDGTDTNLNYNRWCLFDAVKLYNGMDLK